MFQQSRVQKLVDIVCVFIFASILREKHELYYFYSSVSEALGIDIDAYTGVNDANMLIYPMLMDLSEKVPESIYSDIYYELLLTKQNTYCLHDIMYDWLSSYLSGRYRKVLLS